MLFFLSLIIVVIFFIETFRKSLKLGYAASVHYLLPLCFFVFLFLNPLLLESSLIRNERFNLIILVGTIGMVAAIRIVPYDFIDVNSNWNIPYQPKYEVKKLWLDLGTLIYFIYLSIQMLMRVLSAGSFAAVFHVNRFEEGLGEDYFAGNMMLILMLFFRFFYYIKTYEFFAKKQYGSFAFLFIYPMLHHSMTALTRFDFVIMFMALIFLIIDEKVSVKTIVTPTSNYFKSRRRINVLRIGLILVPIFFTTIFYMQIANNIRSGQRISSTKEVFSDGYGKVKKNVAMDLNYYNFLYKIYDEKKSKKINYEYGISWVYMPIINFVPRTVWSEKPTTSFSARYTEKLYYKLGTGNPVVTFTILGEGYIQLGLLGVFLAPIIFFFSRYVSVSIMKKINGVKILLFLVMFSLITYFRGEQPIFFVYLDIIYSVIIITFCSRRIV